jgi:ABC-type transporter Mla subunit MlaD
MARSATTEFKVGLFTLGCLGLIVFGYFWSWDGVTANEAVYHVSMVVPSADGLWAGTPVTIAGVEVGSIESIAVEGNAARLVLAIRDDYPLPTDTIANLAASGLLGDRRVALDLGDDEATIPDGGRLQPGPPPGSFDEITRQAEDITGDVKAITKVVRELLEDRRNTDAVEASLQNVEAITHEVRLLAERNRADVDAIVDSVRRLTDHLEGMAADTRPEVAEELDKLQVATDELQGTLEDQIGRAHV